MGYTTYFEGEFKLNKPLTVAHKAYLEAFATTRRMQRNPTLTAQRLDPKRIAVGLPVGVEGEFFVGELGYSGQEEGADVTDGNNPPSTQPGLGCKWIPTEDGEAIEWDGMEKFYEYVEWIEYLVKNFLNPWGYRVNGTVTWSGEDSNDHGKIIIKNNKVTTKRGKVVYD